MKYTELAQKVKTKYPGEYDDLDDKTLAQKIVAKYPEYSDTTFDEQPKTEPVASKEESKPLIPKVITDNALKVTEFMPPLPGIKTAATAIAGGLKANPPKQSDIPAMAAQAATMGLPVATGIKAGAKAVSMAAGAGAAGKAAEDVIEGKTPSKSSLWEGAKQGAYELAGKALERVGKVAPRLASKALGFSKGMLSNKRAQKAAVDAGEMALDKGVLKPWRTPEGMREAVEGIKSDAGEKIGGFLEKAKGGFYVKKAINALESVRPAERGGMWDTIHGQIDNAVATLKGVGEDTVISYKKANEIKSMFQEAANYRRNPKATMLDQKIAGLIKDNIDESLSYAHGLEESAKKEFQEFLKNKKVYGLMSKAEDALNNRIGSDMGKELFGLHDLVAVATGGVGLDLAYRATKKLGTANTALAARKVGQFGKALPGILRVGESSAKK